MEPTERWTPQSASDLYDVASWGKGYFSVGENGHVLVHPEKEPLRSIDLKELVDTLVLRGINLPILIRFADILKHRLGEMHDAFETAINEHKYQGRLLLRLPDQGQPAAAGGGRGAGVRPAVQLRPGSRLETGTAGGDGAGRQRHADHLQRLQGRRVHRDGDAGAEDGPQDHPGGREVHRAGT